MPNLKCLLPLLVAFFMLACGKEFICENAETCEAIGKIYLYGIDRGGWVSLSSRVTDRSPQELKQAKTFFQKACDLNSASGCYELSLVLRAIQKGSKNYRVADSTDSDEITKIGKKACELDKTPGYVCLYMAFRYNPDESPISAKLRRDFLTRACELSYYESETEGDTRVKEADAGGSSCYLAGKEWFKTDKQKAIAIYEKACEYEDGLSCKELGRIYVEGLGVKADINRAKEYYEKAEMYRVKIIKPSDECEWCE